MAHGAFGKTFSDFLKASDQVRIKDYLLTDQGHRRFAGVFFCTVPDTEEKMKFLFEKSCFKEMKQDWTKYENIQNSVDKTVLWLYTLSNLLRR